MPQSNYNDDSKNRHRRFWAVSGYLGFLIFTGLFITGCIFIPALWPALTFIGGTLLCIATATGGGTLGAILGAAGNSRGGDIESGIGAFAIGVLGAGIGLGVGIALLCLIPQLPYLVITLATSGLAVALAATLITTTILKGFCSLLGFGGNKNRSHDSDNHGNDYRPSPSPSSTAKTNAILRVNTKPVVESKFEEVVAVENSVTLTNALASSSSEPVPTEPQSSGTHSSTSSIKTKQTMQKSYSLNDLQKANLLSRPLVSKKENSPTYSDDQPGLMVTRKRKVS